MTLSAEIKAGYTIEEEKLPFVALQQDLEHEQAH
ncbi:hypothetical protein COLO4_37751 [Corchorus olitorius]|uniref:Uncharacterized protein n=1 Tax=Corchorus olitorius TaxID=93759 RepID=A0A1R3FZS0_9ROSI|nr:hypothetical protein COLO4_37751 [Corchorus olitorius]